MAHPDYGAAQQELVDKKTEKDPLVESNSVSEVAGVAESRLSHGVSLDNPEFRFLVLGVLLFTFIIPGLVNISIEVDDDICTTDYCKVWITSYCCILGGLFCYEFTFLYLWFGIDSRESIKVTRTRKFAGILVGIGGILLIAAVSDNLSNRTDKVGFFGIYLFPILTSLTLASDLMYDGKFLKDIRIRCITISGIIFIASLLILIDADWSFTNSVESVYVVGWLITMIFAFSICAGVITGLYHYFKTNYHPTFIALNYLKFCFLFTGVSFTMCYGEGYIQETRMAFLVFGECAIVSIEIFLL